MRSVKIHRIGDIIVFYEQVSAAVSRNIDLRGYARSGKVLVHEIKNALSGTARSFYHSLAQGLIIEVDTEILCIAAGIAHKFLAYNGIAQVHYDEHYAYRKGVGYQQEQVSLEAFEYIRHRKVQRNGHSFTLEEEQHRAVAEALAAVLAVYRVDDGYLVYAAHNSQREEHHDDRYGKHRRGAPEHHGTEAGGNGVRAEQAEKYMRNGNAEQYPHCAADKRKAYVLSRKEPSERKGINAHSPHHADLLLFLFKGGDHREAYRHEYDKYHEHAYEEHEHRYYHRHDRFVGKVPEIGITRINIVYFKLCFQPVLDIPDLEILGLFLSELKAVKVGYSVAVGGEHGVVLVGNDIPRPPVELILEEAAYRQLVDISHFRCDAEGVADLRTRYAPERHRQRRTAVRNGEGLVVQVNYQIEPFGHRGDIVILFKERGVFCFVYIPEIYLYIGDQDHFGAAVLCNVLRSREHLVRHTAPAVYPAAA